jgi:regulatory protein YycI of two-component signal transduction system YycFG
MNYKNSKKNQILYIIIFVLLLIILIMIFLNNPLIQESFDDCSKCNQSSQTNQPPIPQLNIQSGISTISPDGTINFPTSFNKTPAIFTQMNVSDGKDSSAYTVQISNITPNGFNYNKKKIFNQSANGINIVRLDNDTSQTFSWIAL